MSQTKEGERLLSYNGTLTPQKGPVILPRYGVTLHCNSSIEKQAARIYQICEGVTSVSRAEPIMVHVPDGTGHRYTPDFLVTLNSGRTITIEDRLRSCEAGECGEVMPPRICVSVV